MLVCVDPYSRYHWSLTDFEVLVLASYIDRYGDSASYYQHHIAPLFLFKGCSAAQQTEQAGSKFNRLSQSRDSATIGIDMYSIGVG